MGNPQSIQGTDSAGGSDHWADEYACPKILAKGDDFVQFGLWFCKDPPRVYTLINWIDASGWELVTMSADESREVYVFRKAKRELLAQEQEQTKKWSALEPRSNRTVYLIPGLLTLAFFMGALAGFKEFCSFRKPLQGCQESL